jgi:hypothetical protein
MRGTWGLVRSTLVSPRLNVTISYSSVGAGNFIAKVTDAIGIKQCDACKRRANVLNNAIRIPSISTFRR